MSTIRTTVTWRWDADEKAWEVTATVPGQSHQHVVFHATDAAEALVEAQRAIARRFSVARDAVEAEWSEDVSHADTRTFMPPHIPA